MLLSFSVATGVAVGWRLAGRHLERHKSALFSASRFRAPRRRLAACRWQENPTTVRLLRDYIAWEPTMSSGGERSGWCAGWSSISREDGVGNRVSGASSWSFREERRGPDRGHSGQLLQDANARTALIVDRTGQMLATVGDPPTFDPMAFASLTAADFSANDQLARMLGEPEFGALFHQGERESLYLADMARRVILVVLFDNRTTLGLVKLRVRPAVERARCGVRGDVCPPRAAAGPQVEAEFVGEAEDEIDKLFGT